MSKQLPVTTAIIVSEHLHVQHRLERLFDILAQADISTIETSNLQDIISQLKRSVVGEVQCVLIDGGAGAELDADEEVIELTATVAMLPDVYPIAVVIDPSKQLIIELFRAGACDVIDLVVDSDERILQILQQAACKYQRCVQRRKRFRNYRYVIEDLLKNLVQTERRSIDLEQMLAGRDSEHGAGDFDPQRQPTIVVVEDDHEVTELLVTELRRRAMTVHAFPNGEDAAASVVKMADRGEAVDLVLTDVRLPGMTGLEVIREMRRVKPNLTAMLMTGYSDTETAIDAVDLGVVGYVVKPFDDIRELIERIQRHAIKSMNSVRERYYVEQIKERHQKGLLRYRKLASDLENLYRELGELRR